MTADSVTIPIELPARIGAARQDLGLGLVGEAADELDYFAREVKRYLDGKTKAVVHEMSTLDEVIDRGKR